MLRLLQNLQSFCLGGIRPLLCYSLPNFWVPEGWSTTQPDEEEVQDGMRVFLSNALPKLQGIEASLLSRAAQLLQLIAPRALYEAVWR